ncbi:hypothetical protein HN51_001440 [Arachis hypogaea]|uniref:Bifunctional inhibitor/plant lipid transfer protein/seed storage helical domain-containing protein n=2 Tax=Arachis TaxID=3817 RepID=A0A445ERH2_ARAHY|nr:14 kDa proline-rich protein DC2.15 [Arachis duranensis]XP_025702194.1 14 kDa proline-rich protein DC2.15 [Arachis hypogaea]XP_057753160.1 14 kDa proline-rich protein DC2.15-like [Arachis stenosperma]RYR78075.1 hypothetical protein Ahy_A01g002819 isoform C [Arachis hypogaea]
MASKTTSLALFLTLNILFFALVSANNAPCPPPPKHNKHHHKGGSGGSGGSGSTPSTPSGGRGTAACPRDALKLGVCANVLNGLLNVTLGQPPVAPCCSLLNGLVDLEAAACLCTALKANVLGLNLNLPISLSLLLNVCSRKVPHGFQCN